jgi:lipopolysaccharide/colanic/teichoic acid biosynthesis glycosyltransferase
MASQADRLIFTTDPVKAAHVPERLNRHWRTLLVFGDAAVVLFVSLVVLNGEGNKLAAAIVASAIICGVFWQSGLYKRSYAVYPRDEVYYACAAIAIAALPIALVLTTVADMTLLSVVLALVFCVVGTSALRVRLHLERRNGAHYYAGIPTISPGAWHDRESASYRLSKRLFDTGLASLAILLFSPIMLAAAIAITLESGAPVLFRQQRVGENGRPFWILKFRTMRNDAGSHWAQPGDDRITKVGAFLRKTSLDELPQLFNVVRGDMSLVGPRPEMVAFAQSFSKDVPNYDQRHVVAPGITGWAQVYLKRNLEPSDVPDVIPYDLFYVEYASRVLDCVIILKTAAEVLFHRAV